MMILILKTLWSPWFISNYFSILSASTVTCLQLCLRTVSDVAATFGPTMKKRVLYYISTFAKK